MPMLLLAASMLIDLTHPFDSKTLYWPAGEGSFQLKQLSYGRTSGGFFYSAYSFCAPEHGGTHIDAPIHFGRGRTDRRHGLRLAFETYCQMVQRFSRHIRLLYREIESLPKHARDPILASVQSLIEIFRGLIERAIETGEVRNVDSRLLALDLMVWRTCGLSTAAFSARISISRHLPMSRAGSFSMAC
jgi:hypothetical protein